MIIRKILRTTSTAKLVTLPKAWTDQMNLESGQSVKMYIDGEKLIITRLK